MRISLPTPFRLRSTLAISFVFAAAGALAAASEAPIALANGRIQLSWTRETDGWHLSRLAVRKGDSWTPYAKPSGLHTVVHVDDQVQQKLVERQREGLAWPFYPERLEAKNGIVHMEQKLPIGTMVTEWALDPEFPSDVRVKMTFTAAKKGKFSMASPTLVVLEQEELSWGMVPGNWYGTTVEKNYELSPEYSQGIPCVPVLTNEKNTMTLSPMLSSKDGLTIAVIPEPGSSVDPWESDRSTRANVRLGLGTMDRYNQLTPVVYSPVLGGRGSELHPGETISLSFRYTIEAAPWFQVFRHAVLDVYRFSDLLGLQKSRESLSTRLERLHKMLRDDKVSGWKINEVRGVKIGANGQKTSDVGAMMMLARAGKDPVMESRIPFLRAYKLEQQETNPGFFQYAATGEYPFESGFSAERGNWIEPLFTTYYTMLDLGNMLLFNPQDEVVRERIRLAGEKLLQWQQQDGSWAVAYDKISHRESFPSLRDLRPTWYGLLVAYRATGDERFLVAARKGADWYLQNAVDKGCFLGACGDALNIWDFTTVFGSQALLDLFDQTKDNRYRDAAITVARIYATSIFTQPIPSNKVKMVKNVAQADWEISQAGLSVEHIRGTASAGPITLSSHAGLFIRMYEATGDEIFADMARAAARGRHFFTDETTGKAAYYTRIDRVAESAKAFPWHAEWQVGWITDYLLAEVRLRSGGQVSFPAGYPTPKVGSHVTYGFSPGHAYGHEAALWLGIGAIRCSTPDAEYICAMDAGEKTLYVFVLNQSPHGQSVTLEVDTKRVLEDASGDAAAWSALAGRVKAGKAANSFDFELQPWGFGAISVSLK